VVVNDVGDGAVVVGVPGRILHYTGSDEFVRYRVP
jgi:serine acetyltransferase